MQRASALFLVAQKHQAPCLLSLPDKTCESYGKSVASDKIESKARELVKYFQPTRGLFKVAAKMFRDAWNNQKTQAEEIAASARLKIKEIDK